MWILLIISLATGEVKARIPYQYRADCETDAAIALTGNWPDTVRVRCERFEGL